MSYLPATLGQIGFATETVALLTLPVLPKEPGAWFLATGGTLAVLAVGTVASRALFAVGAAFGAKALLGTAAAIGLAIGYINTPSYASTEEKVAHSLGGAAAAVGGCALVFGASAAFNVFIKVLGAPAKWLESLPSKTVWVMGPDGKILPYTIFNP